MRRALLLFGIVFLVYVVFSRGGYDGYELENLLTAENIILNQKLSLAGGYFNLPGIPNTNDGQIHYVRHGIAQPLLEVPFYALGYGLSRLVHLRAPEVPTSVSNIADLDMVRLLTVSLFNPLVTALTVVMLFWLVKIMFGQENIALASGLIYGLATIAWPYAEIGMEPLFVFLLVLSFYLLFQQNYRWAGVSLALLINTKSYAPVFAVVLLLYFLWGKRGEEVKKLKNLKIFWLSVLAGFLIYFGFNYLRYDAFFNPGESGSFLNSWSFAFLPIGFAASFLSLGKSVWAYSPVLLLVLSGQREFRRRFPSEFFLFVSIFLISVLLFLPSWYVLADEMWGPRYLLPLVPFLLLMSIPTLKRLSKSVRGRVAATVLISLSFLIQLPGVMFWSPASIEAAQAVGAKTMEEIAFVPQYSPVVVGQRLLWFPTFQTHTVPDTVASGTSPKRSEEVDLSRYNRVVILPARFLFLK